MELANMISFNNVAHFTPILILFSAKVRTAKLLEETWTSWHIGILQLEGKTQFSFFFVMNWAFRFLKHTFELCFTAETFFTIVIWLFCHFIVHILFTTIFQCNKKGAEEHNADQFEAWFLSNKLKFAIAISSCQDTRKLKTKQKVGRGQFCRNVSLLAKKMKAYPFTDMCCMLFLLRWC